MERRYQSPVAAERGLLVSLAAKFPNGKVNVERLAIIYSHIEWLYQSIGDDLTPRTYAQWAKSFPWLNERKVREALTQLTACGLLTARQSPGEATVFIPAADFGTLTVTVSESAGEAQGVSRSPAGGSADHRQGHNNNVLGNLKREVIGKSEEGSCPVPSGTGGARKAAGKSANGKRGNTEAELALLPVFDRCAEIIRVAREDAGLSYAKQEQPAALQVLEQTIRLNGYSAETIEAACRWNFSADCPSLEFNLANLSFIHRWRKKWATGLAVISLIDKYHRRNIAALRPKLLTPEVVAPQYVFPNRQLGVIKL